MNTNPNATRILCYGDSNTRGRHPNGIKERYAANVRWTGLLQDKLGNGFEIIEEGVSGRTTALDTDGKNGKAYLKPCLESHNPLDIVILMLGTNDLLTIYDQSAKEIAANIAELIEMITTFAWDRNGKAPKVILLSPPHINEHTEIAKEKFKGAEAKSKELGRYYKEVADRFDCSFLDTAEYIKPTDIDGYHLDPEGHLALSQVLAEKIIELM